MRRFLAVAAVVAACDSSATTDAASGAPAPQVTPQTAPTARTEVGAPPTTPLDAEARARLRSATQTLQTSGCEGTAFDDIRALQRTHGDPPPLIEAQRLAYRVCEDPLADAALLARTLPPGATTQAKLRVGAAWLRAARYEEAVAVLEPLVESEGTSSKAAWLTGFGLFHAGASSRARPLLEAARGHAPAGRADAWLLIGLCKLHEGDLRGATAELEAGVEQVTDDPSLWSALSRAYAASGRVEDAARAKARALEANDARALAERTTMRLAANATAFKRAARAQDVAEVERIFERMWDDAPRKLRVQLLQARARVYANAALDDRADADRARAEALSATMNTDPRPTP
ncbi:MAG: tetratricopeptide repeat protein [Nannocystaceae bacterium]|nr:hypothetical protein [bacterium]